VGRSRALAAEGVSRGPRPCHMAGFVRYAAESTASTTLVRNRRHQIIEQPGTLVKHDSTRLANQDTMTGTDNGREPVSGVPFQQKTRHKQIQIQRVDRTVGIPPSLRLEWLDSCDADQGNVAQCFQ